MASVSRIATPRACARPLAVSAAASRRRRVTCCASKLISKTEISPFIPRSDLMEQMYRWASLEVKNDGVANFGIPCEIEFIAREETPWGFVVHMEREGKVVTSIRMGFDEEVVDKHQFVGRDERGMPKPEGEVTQVVGANFEITKICDNTVDEALRESIRSLCIGASEALNRYYAFGSVFSEDM